LFVSYCRFDGLRIGPERKRSERQHCDDKRPHGFSPEQMVVDQTVSFRYLTLID
jgi:hypothetical protein